jgi:hypothetical protein
MRQLTRCVTTVAAIVVATPGAMIAIGAGIAGAETILPFAQTFRRCDFSANTFTGPTGYAMPTAVLRVGSNEVVADVNIATAVPFTHYDVRLIQVPRPSSKPCGAGDPGVAVSGLMTDGAGAGSTTVRGNIEPGATGVWMFVSRPDAFRQTPAESYTSDLIVAI